MTTTWNDMDQQPRLQGAEITRADLPESPGVYAWYRNGKPIYVGKATGRQGLRQRVWNNHLRQGRGAISGSAFRRNVAEHLGYGRASAIKADPVSLSDDAIEAVNAWVRGCELAFMQTDDGEAALEMERDLKAEHKPPLTKR